METSVTRKNIFSVSSYVCMSTLERLRKVGKFWVMINVDKTLRKTGEVTIFFFFHEELKNIIYITVRI